MDRARTIRISTFPSSNHPVPLVKSQSESQKPCASASAVFRQSPHLGTTRPSEPRPPPAKENLWVSSTRVPFPQDIITRGSRSQEPVPPRYEPVPPYWEYYNTWMWRETPPIYKGGNPQQSSETNYLRSSIVYFTTYDLNCKREKIGLWILLFYFILLIFFPDFSKPIGISLRIIPPWLWI